MRTTKNIAEDLYASYLELAQIVDPTKTQEYPKPPVDINKLARMVEQFDKRLEAIEAKMKDCWCHGSEKCATEAKLEGKKEEDSSVYCGILGTERCEEKYPMSKLQCTKLKGHSDNHRTALGEEVLFWDSIGTPTSRPAWIKEDGSVIWEKVPVDTKMLTKDIEGTWAKGYFAYYEEGAVYWFKNGATSWSEEKCTWTCDRNAKLA